MILVTVGMTPYSFDRLVRVADELARSIDEPVVIQTGSSSYSPRFVQYFDYASPENMEKWIRDARVVVTHCAAGSILSVLAVGRPLVVIPRSKHFGEHSDDHQLELGEALTGARRVVCLTDITPKGLEQAIDKASQIYGAPVPDDAPLVKALAEYLAAL